MLVGWGAGGAWFRPLHCDPGGLSLIQAQTNIQEPENYDGGEQMYFF